MKIEISLISKRLKNLREQREVTQEELAKNLGVSRQSIISLEQGRCLPSLPLAVSFAEFFELPLEHIFCLNKPIELEKSNNQGKEAFMPRDLGPWSPLRDLGSLHDSIDQFFEESFPVMSKVNLPVPTVNVYEKDNAVVVKADLPGIKEEDLSVEVSEDHLVIRGERKSEEEVDEKNYYRRETSFGSFLRTIPLPSEVDKDKVEAELKDGILTISMPKAALPEPKITKIKVKKS